MVTGLSHQEAPTTDGAIDAKAEMVKNLFIGAALGILRAENVVRPDDNITHPALQDSIQKWFEFSGNDWTVVVLNVTDAILAYEAWITEGAYEYHAPVLYTVSNLTITATMQTQSGQLSVAMQIYPTDGTELPDVIRAAKGELQDAIGRAFSGQPTPPLPETTRSAPTSEFATVKSIKVEAKDGKLQYRMMPASGRWVKFGVPLYPDKKTEFNIPDMMPGEYPAQGTMEIELKSDGKPARVIGYRN